MARPRSFDEAAVVAAARDRFWSSGYAGTGVADLVDATGVAKGSLYNTFGDKHTLYVRSFESYCTAILDTWSRELDGPDDDAGERIRHLVDRLAVISATGPVPPTSCFLAKATAELAAHDPDVAAIARRTFDALEDLLAGCVRAARRAGDLAGSLDSRAVARHILATLRGMEALAAAGVDPSVLRDAATGLTQCVLTPTT